MPSSTRRPDESGGRPRGSRLTIRDSAVFAVLGTLMYISFAIMQGLPNVHLIAVFVGAITLTYRVRALIPIYIYVLLYGIFSGFSFFWLPYLYIWLPLWGAFVLVGRLRLQKKVQVPKHVEICLYMLLCGLHGLTFGIMYAPVQALFFGLSFKGMIAWIAAGFVFDAIHAASNFVLAGLILPLSELLNRLSNER